MNKKTKIVAKDNALINASYNLTLVEQRLILLAIFEARQSKKGINANDPLTVYASSYSGLFGGGDRDIGYKALKNACNTLFERQFSYQQLNEKGQVENYRSRWVSVIGYVEGEAAVKMIFAPPVIPLITELEKHFTSYDLEQVANLSSAYAVRLYELLIAWRSTGETPVFELEDFRNKLGVAVGEYSTMSNFKSYVLDLAINQINEHTDISAEYEQHKRGRTITGFSFTFTQKSFTKKPETAKRGRKPKVSDKVATPSEMDIPVLPPKQRKKPDRSATDILKTVLAKK